MTAPAAPPGTHRYGPAPSQYAELYLPAARTRPGTAVLVHGGYWRARYDAGLGRPLAADLAARGWVAWNLEYRRTGGPEGDRGGWPETFEDVAAGIDLLAPVLGSLGLEPGPVVVVGHSAGGHLGAWAAGRHTLPAGAPGSGPAVRPAGVVSQAGVLDLAEAGRLGLSDGAARELMGADPERDPERWALADPARMLPIGVPVVALHGDADDAVPDALSRGYARAARAAGDPARFAWMPGDHFAPITPGTAAWEACVDALSELTGARRDRPGAAPGRPRGRGGAARPVY
ncbi:alpha/beta hydrolase family protein [Arthrobacter halodurans]|uniref:Alpha/beta hydrolase family protein n=1 Tax=Arthrobacter halodurans TaxID=516699 RepID=A0ABV4UR82_9MICC